MTFIDRSVVLSRAVTILRSRETYLCIGCLRMVSMSRVYGLYKSGCAECGACKQQVLLLGYVRVASSARWSLALWWSFRMQEDAWYRAGASFANTKQAAGLRRLRSSQQRAHEVETVCVHVVGDGLDCRRMSPVAVARKCGGYSVLVSSRWSKYFLLVMTRHLGSI